MTRCLKMLHGITKTPPTEMYAAKYSTGKQTSSSHCSGQACRRTERGATDHRRSVIDSFRIDAGRSHGCTPGRYHHLHRRSVWFGQRDWTSAHSIVAENSLSSVVDGRQLRQSVADTAARRPIALPTGIRYAVVAVQSGPKTKPLMFLNKCATVCTSKACCVRFE